MPSPTPRRFPSPASTLIALSMAVSSSFAVGPTPLPLAAVTASTAFSLASLADPEAAEISGLAFADAEVVKALTLLEAGKASEAVAGLTALIESKELAKSPRADELRLALCMIRVRTGESSKAADDLKRMASASASKTAGAAPVPATARVLQRAAASKSLGRAGDLKKREGWITLLNAARAECAADFEKHTEDLGKALKAENLAAIKASAAKSHAAIDELSAITVESADTEKLAVACATKLSPSLEAFGGKGAEMTAKIDRLRAEWREIGEKRRAARDNGGKPQDFIAPQKAKAAEVDAARAAQDAWLDAAQPAVAFYNQVQARYSAAIPKLSVSIPAK